MVSTEFANEVKDRVEQRMGGGAEASIVHTWKNNGIRLTGLTVRRPDSNVAPTVYIEDFEGHGADEAAEMAIRLIERSEEGVDQDALAREAAGFIGNRNGVLKRVLPRVINRKWNREMLEEMPHRGFLDLAITYQVPVGGMGSVRITRRSWMSSGSLQKYTTGLWVSSSLYRPIWPTLATGTRLRRPSTMPMPARRMSYMAPQWRTPGSRDARCSPSAGYWRAPASLRFQRRIP